MSCVDVLQQQLSRIMTCDSFFTTQMIQLESTVLTENNTFDVYAATIAWLHKAKFVTCDSICTMQMI